MVLFASRLETFLRYSRNHLYTESGKRNKGGKSNCGTVKINDALCTNGHHPVPGRSLYIGPVPVKTPSDARAIQIRSQDNFKALDDTKAVMPFLRENVTDTNFTAIPEVFASNF